MNLSRNWPGQCQRRAECWPQPWWRHSGRIQSRPPEARFGWSTCNGQISWRCPHRWSGFGRCRKSPLPGWCWGGVSCHCWSLPLRRAWRPEIGIPDYGTVYRSLFRSWYSVGGLGRGLPGWRHRVSLRGVLQMRREHSINHSTREVLEKRGHSVLGWYCWITVQNIRELERKGNGISIGYTMPLESGKTQQACQYCCSSTAACCWACRLCTRNASQLALADLAYFLLG